MCNTSIDSQFAFIRVRLVTYSILCYVKVFTKEKRLTTTKISLDEMVKNMLQCKGHPNEGWRRPGGFWGNVIVKSGLSNTEYSRRMIYDRWHKNWHDVKQTFMRMQSNCRAEREVMSFNFVCKL